jgi:hypothetical protein
MFATSLGDDAGYADHVAARANFLKAGAWSADCT